MIFSVFVLCAFCSFASKVRNHCWTGSVQGAVATWLVISMRSLMILDCHGLTRSLPLPVLTRSKCASYSLRHQSHSQGQFLIQDASISYAPSVTVLREMTKRRLRQTPTHEPATLLAFGNPMSGRHPGPRTGTPDFELLGASLWLKFSYLPVSFGTEKLPPDN